MSNYLASLSAKVPQHSELVASIQQFHEKKLWHQLTDKIEEFIELPGIAQSVDLVQFYHSVIADFAVRTNQLRLAHIAVKIAGHAPSLNEKLAFLQSIAAVKHVADSKEASVVLGSAICELQIQAGSIDEASDAIEKLEETLESLQTADASVHAAFYKARAQLYKAKNETELFYRNGLQYLSYAQLDAIPVSEKVALAFDLGIAALTAKSVYNFGELLEKGILESLRGTEHEWLDSILNVVNSGDITSWHILAKKHSFALAKHLAGFEALLEQKSAILSVIELIFNRNSEDRNVSFEQIATASNTPLQEVEHLIMKSLSLGLIKGRIDQINSTFNVTWVQPRVLSDQQVTMMKDRLFKWRETVSGALSLVENQMSPELLS